MGKARREALRVDFDRSIKLEFHGAKVSSDGGLLAYRELDEALHLTEMAQEALTDLRTGDNIQHDLVALLLQSIFSHLAEPGVLPAWTIVYNRRPARRHHRHPPRPRPERAT